MTASAGGMPPEDALTDLLRSVGVPDAEIAAASQAGERELLAMERLAIAEPETYDLDQISSLTGIEPDHIRQLWRSLGFVEPLPGDRLFTEVDVDMLRVIQLFVDNGVIDADLTVQMARVIGSSMSRLAAGLVDAIEPSDVTEDPVIAGGDDFADTVLILVPTLLQVMEYVWRRHVQAEARARRTREQGALEGDSRVVGFADLVGYTALSQQISSHELAAMVDRFEGIAYDTVGALGGRVVKMIGDEVMFAAPDERTAAEIALSLAEAYARDDDLSDVRVGLASGSALQRDGDLYGPVVNLASRIVNLAFPGTVLATAELAEALAADPAFESKLIGSKKLKGIGRVPVTVLRRADAPELEPSGRREQDERRAARRDERLRAGDGDLEAPEGPHE